MASANLAGPFSRGGVKPLSGVALKAEGCAKFPAFSKLELYFF